MKRCPACNRIYTDNTLRFCLEDSTPLETIEVDTNATLIMPAPFSGSLAPTVISSSDLPSTQLHNRGINQYEAILESLRAILKQCEETKARLGYPGEGGERAFRGWLVTDFLAIVLGWPTARIVVGERFDILLQDSESFPVVTIETKTPYHKVSKKEHDDFEARLSGFGTLHTAYLTNGAEWKRLDISSPTGALEIRDRFNLHLERATAEEAEAFFAPLTADRYISGASRSARHGVSRENPHILEALAADLDQVIGDLALFLEALFEGLLERKAGEQTRNVTLSVFDLWCEKALTVSPRQAAVQFVDRFKEDDLKPRDIAKAVSDLGFSGSEATTASDALASLSKDARRNTNIVADTLWPAYRSAARKLCAQTAHVMVARALLYRIGEDQDVFPRLLSGEEMEAALVKQPSAVVDEPKPATNLLARVQLSMRDFLPSIYELGEFDWWQVLPEKRSLLKAGERTWLHQMDAEFERASQRLLRMLNGYFFGRVDVDVWRNVYQHYLPADERQRLGGFYTPDELIHLILDLAGFTPEAKGLCRLSFIDPACGSGAFVTTALARLLKHLELDLDCHDEINSRGVPEWKRAEAILNIAAKNLHGVDLHPFAAFLTTLNALFLLMPLYVKARSKNPEFSLDLQIFSSDVLEKHDEDLLEPDLFTKLNAGVQLTEESFHRYQEMLSIRFDRVFGNPPWGGVLKGPLAPVYDTAKKRRFEREYPAAARGKYDIYGLFMERALQILNPGGRFALITQGSFIDKEWAAGLRKLLATKSRLRFIIDLNPFGQLFFNAMNIPCITVTDVAPATDSKGECVAILSTPPDDFKGLTTEKRRERVEATILEAAEKVSGRRKSVKVNFAHAARVPLKRLVETAADRWNLAAAETVKVIREGWLTAADVLEPMQGVTVGGEGCLEIFLMSDDEAKQYELELELIHPVIKGRETIRWKMPQADHVIFYPYAVDDKGSRPAFTLNRAKVKDRETREALKSRGITDGLDFDKQLDQREQEIVHRHGTNRNTVQELLRHRIILDLIAYPKAASYLVQHYEQLEGRVFKKRNIRKFKRRWYEYIWHRDPEVIMAKPKLITPRLAKEARFALDKRGIVPQDSCICMMPTRKTNRSYQSLRKQLAEALGRRVSLDDVLKYCLAFLNSDYAQERLVAGHRPRPGEVYAITESVLREIPIPPPTDDKAAAILDLVTKLIKAKDETVTTCLENDLNQIVLASIG